MTYCLHQASDMTSSMTTNLSTSSASTVTSRMRHDRRKPNSSDSLTFSKLLKTICDNLNGYTRHCNGLLWRVVLSCNIIIFFFAYKNYTIYHLRGRISRVVSFSSYHIVNTIEQFANSCRLVLISTETLLSTQQPFNAALSISLSLPNGCRVYLATTTSARMHLSETKGTPDNQLSTIAAAASVYSANSGKRSAAV